MMARARLAVVAAAVALGSLSCGSDVTAPPSILEIEAGIPAVWFRVGGTQATYVVGVDSKHAHGGRYALAIGGTDTSVLRFNGVGQNLRADPYRGKRLRLSAWVRQVGVTGSDIGLWMRVDGPGVMQAFDNFSTRPLVGTADWHQVEIILDIPPDAIGIALGALMSGRGELLVDDMQFEVVPATGPSTNQLLGYQPLSLDSATVVGLYAGLPTLPSNLNFESK
jgi:hypothetical protein